MVEFLFVTQAGVNPRLTLLDRESPRELHHLSDFWPKRKRGGGDMSLPPSSAAT